MAEGSERPQRVAEVAALAVIAAAGTAALARGQGAALFCCHDRTCTRTQEHCPAGITRQDELAAAAQADDHARFIRHGGLACLRCGNCEPHCGERLPLARHFAAQQARSAAMLGRPAVTPAVAAACRDALAAGLVGPEHIEQVLPHVQQHFPEDT